MSNEIEAILFDRAGLNPQTVVPTVDSVTWRHNNTGVAKLFLPYSDPLCTPERLALGNRFMVRFASGLPDFGGVIDVPRVPTETGVQFSVYTGDRILDWRQTAKQETYMNVPPGEIAQGLVRYTNRIKVTGIDLGSIVMSVNRRTETYNLANILDALQRLARQSAEEYKVVPVYASGKLSFEFLWAPQLGHDYSGSVSLVEGRNVETPLEMTEQGPIASVTKAVGGGAGGTSWDDRLVGTAISTDAEATYGYREYAEVITGVFDQDTLDATAEATLTTLDHSRKHFKATVVDADPSPYSTYDVGDIVKMNAFLERGEWAYEGSVRVMGRSWDASNACRLEVVEWS